MANALTGLMLAVSIVRELETGNLFADFHDSLPQARWGSPT
ncbi:hypothetical protein [Streptomyces wuyuanensis]|nr:hypothetical protein [Streptomyces wuyuanensis]